MPISLDTEILTLLFCSLLTIHEHSKVSIYFCTAAKKVPVSSVPEELQFPV